ncbi:hypothetical protein CE91St47_15560 [Eubacteriales bacterium]|nr:hypothetical protein CE91St47_15560 [Eubacteriales bacterium]
MIKNERCNFQEIHPYWNYGRYGQIHRLAGEEKHNPRRLAADTPVGQVKFG